MIQSGRLISDEEKSGAGKRGWIALMTALALSASAYNGAIAMPAFHLETEVKANKTVTGKVTDENGEGIPGVSIVVKGTTTGTVSSVDGTYSINVPDNGGTLIFSSVGYISQEIAVGSRAAIDVKLATDSKALSEVVVVGYGSQLKKEVTGSVQTVGAAEIKDLPVTQVTQKLQGRVAGVQINQATGKPGQGMSVRIRGQVSVSAGSDPLYVIDGFPITGNIGALNPDEIEEISILKDAASTSLYGSRAANGVVLITTKKGKPGETNVNFNAYYGFQKVPMRGRIEMLNAEEFAQFKKEYYEDMNQPVPAEFKNPSEYRGKNNDWYDALLRTAPIQSYNLTLTSNKENLKTSLVAGVLNQDGVVINNNYKRYSLRMNTEYDINKYVKVGFNIAPQYVYDNTPRTDGDRGTGIIFNALHTWPVMPIHDANGQLTMYNEFPSSTGNIFKYPNWVRASNEITNENKNTKMLGNTYLVISPIKGLTLKTTLNIEYENNKFFYFNPSTATSVMNVQIPTNASTTRQGLINSGWLNENLATYNRSFGDHNFELLAGFTQQRYRQEFETINASVYADDRLPTIQGALNINRGGTLNGINAWSLTSYLSCLLPRCVQMDPHVLVRITFGEHSLRFRQVG